MTWATWDEMNMWLAAQRGDPGTTEGAFVNYQADRARGWMAVTTALGTDHVVCGTRAEEIRSTYMAIARRKYEHALRRIGAHP